MSRTVCVVGALRADLSVTAPRAPVAGETVIGGGLRTGPGGRGASQAVAAARLGAHARIVGCVGDDAWGSELRAAFASDGVDATGLFTAPDQPTGAALVAVHPDGQSSILFAPGANDALTPEMVDTQEDAIAGADVLLVQLELAHETLERAVAVARTAGTLVVLHAAPVRELASDFLDQIDVLVVGESQGRRLIGCDAEVEAIGVARRLKAKSGGRVVVMLDNGGAVAFDGENKVLQDALGPAPIDATAASDAFVAALALAIIEEQRIESALAFATGAASIAGAREGAIRSLPARAEVEELLGIENGPGASTVHSNS